MTDEEDLEEMGPIDYLVIEWPGGRPHGEVAPRLLELVEAGLIRVLDLAFVAKDADGNVVALDFEQLAEDVIELSIFEGAASGLLGDEDHAEVGAVLEPDTAAAVIVFENVWAAPFATAVRRSGGQLVAGGRIPVQAMLAALDAVEAA
ncbi:MAG: DUF1269 domain-containing protein [Actinobacteria bacterium]|nr:DUF1269 domain-containing protein [Actinomycetota bacterium]